jgi:hypothetical protein
MNDITVVITGMILLMSPAAYISGGNPTIHAAVSVNANDPKSSYGMDIPQHFSALYLPGKKSAFPYSDDLGKRIIDIDDKNSRVDLNGDLVQLGTFSGNICTPYPNDPNEKASPTVTNSIKALPRIADLVNDLTLAPKTYPNGRDYSGMDSTKVAAWLEIPLGRLLAVHSNNPQDDEAMFLPPHHSALVAKEVWWHVADKYDHCVMVTPFTSGNKVVVAFSPGSTSITYANDADQESGEVMPGIGFDFEVLYGLLATPPAMPPVPFSVGLISQGLNPKNANAHSAHGHVMKKSNNTDQDKGIFNATTGVNCGPATIPSGG